MALVIVATAGAHTANSYITLTEAEAYVLTMCDYAAWTAGTEATKNAALAQATRHIDELSFIDEKYHYDLEDDEALYQALEFPRIDMVDGDGVLYIPAKVKLGCAVQAVYEMRRAAAKQATSDIMVAGVSSYSSGSYSETLDRNLASVVCDDAKALLRQWIKSTVTLMRK